MNAPVVVVLCTAPAAGGDGKLGAIDLARRLVEERLCACVNVLPAVRSFFRWQETVEEAAELLLMVKTTAQAASALRARIAELHPYQVPEVLELAVDGGLPAYLEWLGDSVRPGRA